MLFMGGEEQKVVCGWVPGTPVMLAPSLNILSQKDIKLTPGNLVLSL